MNCTGGGFPMAKRALLEMCSKESFPDNRLPSETELSKMLGVSIVTVRRALTVLEAEGYIIKRHGMGNFVLPSALDPSMRSDLAYGTCSFLEASGFSEVVRRLEYRKIVPCPKQFLSALGLAQAEEVLLLVFRFQADGDVVQTEKFYLPIRYINKQKPWNVDVQSMDQFIWEYCGLELLHTITTWKAQCATDEIQTLLHLPAGTPMVMWEQIVYDIQDHPICGVESYFHPEKIQMRTLFKWNFDPHTH